MREKIMTLTVCITLVYWLGGLAGCATSPRDAQNEDMLKEDKSIFDTSPPAGGGNQFQTQSHQSNSCWRFTHNRINVCAKNLHCGIVQEKEFNFETNFKKQTTN